MNDSALLTRATPVALFAYNRPAPTAAVLQAIARARPRTLFLITDGPRSDRPADSVACATVQGILQNIDWPCKVHRLQSNHNLGCAERMRSGLDWVFSIVDRCILLEDDCLPSDQFFRFCEILLGRYEDDETIRMISGTNLLGHWGADRQSYHFCYHGSIWGWATWARAWRDHDPAMAAWSSADVREAIRRRLHDDEQFADRSRAFDAAASGQLDKWGTQWAFTCLHHGGLVIVPATNLVSNVGFGRHATHTQRSDDSRANHPTLPLSFPLIGPITQEHDAAYARAYFRRFRRRDQQGRAAP